MHVLHLFLCHICFIEKYYLILIDITTRSYKNKYLDYSYELCQCRRIICFFFFPGIGYRILSICWACISEVHKHHSDPTVGKGFSNLISWLFMNQRFWFVYLFLFGSLLLLYSSLKFSLCWMLVFFVTFWPTISSGNATSSYCLVWI